MDYKEKIIKLLLENINLSGIAIGLIDEVLEEALKKIVADTSNPFDDMLMATVYPALEAALKEMIEAKINEILAGLQG